MTTRELPRLEDMTRLKNAREFIIPVMRSGVVNYSDDFGVLNVTNEFLAKIAPTAKGNPLIIFHESIEGVLNEESVQDTAVVGRVGEYFQDGELWYARAFVEFKEAAEKLESEGWGVSTAWLAKEIDETSGTWNQIEYDGTAIDGEYEHLAIVPNPRYEMAKDAKFLNSLQPARAGDNIKSTTKGVLGMLSIFSKKKDGLVKVGNEAHKVSHMVKVINEAEEAAKKKENEEAYLNSDDKVKCGDEEMTVAELVERFEASKKALASDDEKAENEEDKAENEDKAECSDDDKAEGSDAEENLEDVKENSEDEKKEASDDDKAENEEDDKAENEDDKKAENAAKFKKIKNSAATGAQHVVHTQLTTFEKMARGQSKWGS